MQVLLVFLSGEREAGAKWSKDHRECPTANAVLFSRGDDV